MLTGAMMLMLLAGVPILLNRLLPDYAKDKLVHILRFEEDGKW